MYNYFRHFSMLGGHQREEAPRDSPITGVSTFYILIPSPPPAAAALEKRQASIAVHTRLLLADNANRKGVFLLGPTGPGIYLVTILHQFPCSHSLPPKLFYAWMRLRRMRRLLMTPKSIMPTIRKARRPQASLYYWSHTPHQPANS